VKGRRGPALHMAAGPARRYPAGFTGCSPHSLLQAAIKTIRSAFECVQASGLLHGPLQFALPRSQAGKLSGARRGEPLRRRGSGLAGRQGTSSGNPGQGDPLPVPSAGMSGLALVCLGGVVVGGRVLTRPLKKLAAAAMQVHSGNFDLERLPDSGPREVVTTTAAFNNMASTLKAVEAKAVALAAEDLSDPELLTPLPGRTGNALQASVDTLAIRIREREVQRQLLHEAATHDALTGLLNRAAILEFLAHDVSRRREAGETVAVLFIDLDGLKPLNDTYGHEVGDTAILATGMALMQATEECDVVGRLGGDEFLVVLCHEHSCNGDAVVERIRDSVAQCRIPVQDVLVPLEASVGVALTQCDSDTDPMLLVRQADEAMYEAKKAARAIRDRFTSANS